MTKAITILDYGMCNMLNVARAFQKIGMDVNVTENAAQAAAAERLVVPGVGAFRDSIEEVRSRGFDEAIFGFIATGRPFLGICVGMQMLFEASEEFGDHKGLGVMGGRVKPVPATAVSGETQRVPHIGWNHLLEPHVGRDWTGTPLQEYASMAPAVYFVHSFAAVPSNDIDRLADCDYGGYRLCAAVARDNIVATQFHPERSGAIGLNILRRFAAN